MKDFVFGTVLTAVLVIYFSAAGIAELTPTNRSGTQLQGESDLVLPGNGEEPVNEVVFQTKEAAESETHNTVSKEAEKEIPFRVFVEKEQGMNDLLLMFWHGVAAVLIGEASALLVAIVWRKERK